MEKKIKVASRFRGECSLEVSKGVFRRWAHRGAEVLMSEDEIINAANSKGGRITIENYLMINDKALLKKLGMEVEQEYFYNTKSVKALLQLGSLEDLESALAANNEGIRMMIKDIAIEIRLSDLSKRNLISKFTGVDLNKVIEFADENNSFKEDDSEDENLTIKTKRKDFSDFQGNF